MSELVKAALAAAEGITAEETFDTFVEGVAQQRSDPVVVIPHSIPDSPEPMLYREWDMDNDLVIEYERHGHCLRCGECCRHRIAFCYTDDKTQPGIYGIWSEVSDEAARWFVRLCEIDPDRTKGARHPCSALTKDGLCSFWGQPTGRKEICHFWPFSSRCLEHFPQCGYSFTEVARDAISTAYPSIWAILKEERQKEKEEDDEKVPAVSQL